MNSVSSYNIASIIIQTTQHNDFAVTTFRLLDSQKNEVMEVRVFGPNQNDKAASIELLPTREANT